ncbi:MAG: LexA family transcriptional regulator [Labilithrix sp.]|nr:LexA family transcriptional regulator [Labilithrix sp.]
MPSSEGLIYRVARAIAARRRALGLTQEALAERLELATKNVQRIESGAQNLTLATLERIAVALETTPGTLLGVAAAERDTGATAVVPAAIARLEAAGYRVRAASAPGRRSIAAVPLTTIRAAAGSAFGSARSVEALGWVTLNRRGEPPKGQFVASIEGRSMEPRVPDGAICLFGPPGPQPYRDRIFLVAHSAIEEEGLEGPFALKQIEAKKRRDDSRRITLRSLNPDFPPIVIDDRNGDLRIIAELVSVLAPPEPAPR